MKTYTELKTFEDACKYLGLDPVKVLPDFSLFPEEDQKAMVAHTKLIIIAKVANKIENGGEIWKPDWSNGEWDKYYPWFDMNDKDSASRFSYYVDGYWGATSSVGSRLCFKSRELAKYIGTQFLDLYEAYFVQ